jgi:molybdenum cofactor cytidylyltransferase
MGPRNKLLIPDASGSPMIARTVDAVLASRTRPVLVVVGHQADAITAALAGRPVTIVAAPDYKDGLSASLRAGLAALPPDAAATLICLGDMPLVSPAEINRLLAAYDPAAGARIIVPTHNGQRGNPVLWDRTFFPAMNTLSGDTGARSLLQRFADDVTETEIQTDSILMDFDTPQTI